MASSAGVIFALARSKARSHTAIGFFGFIRLPGATLPFATAGHHHLAHGALLHRRMRIGEPV